MKKAIFIVLMGILSVIAGAAVAESAPIFVKVDTITVNLTSDGNDQYLQTDIEFQVPNASVAEKVKECVPEIRNNLILLLSSKTASILSSTNGKQELNREIKSRVNTILHSHDEDGVSAVLFTSLVVQ